MSYIWADPCIMSMYLLNIVFVNYMIQFHVSKFTRRSFLCYRYPHLIRSYSPPSRPCQRWHIRLTPHQMWHHNEDCSPPGGAACLRLTQCGDTDWGDKNIQVDFVLKLSQCSNENKIPKIFLQSCLKLNFILLCLLFGIPATNMSHIMNSKVSAPSWEVQI